MKSKLEPWKRGSVAGSDGGQGTVVKGWEETKRDDESRIIISIYFIYFIVYNEDYDICMTW